MNEDAYGERLALMQDRIDIAISEFYNAKDTFVHALKHGERIDAVIYSAYEVSPDSDEGEGLPIDNLNEVPFKGTFTVIGEYDEFWDGRGSGVLGDPGNEPGGREYRSEPITDPTWLQLAVLANESIHTTNDYHHVFLENVNLVAGNLYLSFGS